LADTFAGNSAGISPIFLSSTAFFLDTIAINITGEPDLRELGENQVSWQQESLQYLVTHPVCGYHDSGSPASEPTAWAALALTALDHLAAARHACHWLAQHQNADGSVGPTSTQKTPGWPTGCALLAWLGFRSDYETQIVRAAQWLLSSHGTTPPPNPQIGHDPSIPAWSWCAQTHSWVEPTAFHILALVRAGHTHHPRVQQARHMLWNRLLPLGGCNYGNTFVLGQQLRPHVLPTGCALLALAHRADVDQLLHNALDYLIRSISPRTPLLSLAAALQGLAAHDQHPAAADEYLSSALAQTRNFRLSPWKLAWALLAGLGADSPLVQATAAFASVTTSNRKTLQVSSGFEHNPTEV
jgi:hypothetical protein